MNFIKTFSDVHKPFIIAEIGVNHEGKFESAKKMISLAAKAGANAVKFQTFSPNNYISTCQPERFERAKKFSLSRESFKKLAYFAKSKNILFFSTPLHFEDVDFLNPIVPIFKISSGDLTYLQLIKHIGKKKKPIILSTGMGNEKEINNALSVLKSVWPCGYKAGKIMLMHCVSNYPTKPEDANLKNILWLREKYKLPVGYSDHTIGTKACQIAYVMGVKIFEKHFTYKKENQNFHDHLISSDFYELKNLVKSLKEIDTFLGKKHRKRIESKSTVAHMRRSLGAAIDIKKGEKLKPFHITFLRPGSGIKPSELNKILNRKIKKNILAGSLFSYKDFQKNT